MARLPVTRKYTFTVSGATVQLADILGRPTTHWLGSLAMRSGRTNVSDVFWKDGPTGQEGGYIGPSEAVTFDFGFEHAQCRTFSLIGTQGDIVYLTVGENVL